MDEKLKANLLSASHWIRFIYMALFLFILYFSSALMLIVVLMQFAFSLLTGTNNDNLRRFGASLSLYVYQALQYLTYASDSKPFPFNEWPKPETENIVEAEVLEGKVETEHSE